MLHPSTTSSDQRRSSSDSGAASPNGPTPCEGLSIRDLLVVCCLALLVRLIYIHETRGVPTLHHLVGDAAGYKAWATAIASGAWIGKEPFYQAPLYPYWLAVLQLGGVSDVATIRLAQSVMGAASAGLLTVAAALHFGRRIGLVSGLMLALYPPAIFFDGIIQKASLATALTCAMLALVSCLSKRCQPAFCLCLGFVLGLLAITRENAFAWLALLLVWVAWRARGQGASAVRGACFFLLGAGLVLTPVCVRNHYVGGELSPSTFQAGPNFYIGNGALADGRYRPLVRGHETPAFERGDATMLAELAMGKPLSPQAVSRYWMVRAWHEIRSSPGRWLGLLAYKLGLVLNRYEIGDGDNQYVYAKHSWLLGALQKVWHFGVLLPLAAAGLVECRRQRRPVALHVGLLLVMVGAVAMFFVLARYRLPLVPILVPFAGVGAVALARVLIARKRPEATRLLVAAGVVAILANVPIQDEAKLNAMATMNVGVALAQGGDLSTAATFFKEAVDAHPQSAEAQNNLAQALSLTGRPQEAVEHYRAAISVSPTLVGVHYNLGVALEGVGESREALQEYRRAAELNPNDAAARAAIARLQDNP